MAYEDTFGIAPPVAPEIQQPWYQRVGSGINTGINGLLGATSQNYGGLLSEQDQQAAQRRAQLAMASQMLQASGYSPQRVSFGQALGSGLQAGQQAQAQSTEDSVRAALIKKQMTPKQVAPKSVQEYEYAKANGFAGSYEEFRKAGARTPLDPSAVREYEYAKANGYTGSFEEYKRVGAAQHQDPAAIQEYNFFQKLAPEQQASFIDLKRNSQPYQVVDVAGGKGSFNKSTGALSPVSTAAQEAAGAATVAGATTGAKVQAETKATAAIDLPRVEDNATQMLSLLDQLENHPGREMATGRSSILHTSAIPGTDSRDFQTLLTQIGGKQFLEAFNSLKGAGGITEIEGKKATDAIARIQDTGQSESAYLQSIQELRDVVKSGTERARRKAGGGTSPNVSALLDKYAPR